jgi:hypothetical protein
MDNNQLYTLIPLEDFKGLLSIDDRDDRLARFCLVTSTHTIEQYCRRRLLRKKHFERIELAGGEPSLAYARSADDNGDLVLPLREYPVSKVLAVYALGDGEILEPDFYSLKGDELYLSPALRRYPALTAVKVVYVAGFEFGNVPPDLATACLEFASWNFNRYKGRRIGMTGNIRGAGKEGEHFEMSMPENVRALLEPYKRKTI